MKIGFIGLGIMGESMAANVIARHNDTVYVYDVREEKTAAVAEKGGVAAGSAGDLAKASEVIITMVPKSEHVIAVYDGIMDSLGSGKICIDMSTISPQVSIETAGRVKARGADFLDAPVVKSKAAAINAALGIYVSGSPAAYEKIKNILLYMGKNVIYLGENGKALIMKICHNALVAQIQNGVNELMSLAVQNGISIDEFVEAVSYGGAQNFYLDSKSKSIKEADYTTAFSVENMHKDLHLALELLGEDRLREGVRHTVEVYDRAMIGGLGPKDFSAAYDLFRN